MGNHLRTDLLDPVPLQIPARRVAEMRHQRLDTGHVGRRANRILYLVIAVHRGVYTTYLHVLDRPPAGPRI